MGCLLVTFRCALRRILSADSGEVVTTGWPYREDVRLPVHDCALDEPHPFRRLTWRRFIRLAAMSAEPQFVALDR